MQRRGAHNESLLALESPLNAFTLTNQNVAPVCGPVGIAKFAVELGEKVLIVQIIGVYNRVRRKGADVAEEDAVVELAIDEEPSAYDRTGHSRPLKRLSTIGITLRLKCL